MNISMKAFVMLSGIFSTCLLSPAHADIITVTGTTAGGPTYNRPLEDLSGLSAVGTAVPYNLLNFSVTQGGEYSFVTTAKFDSFLALYAAPFNPATPLANALLANDDLLGLTTSGFAANLTAGTSYSLVTTGFGNNDFGVFSDTIGGPGAFVVSPGSPATSDIFTFTGTTAGGPTFNRPLEDLSGLSAVGTAVPYNTFEFEVSVTGEYTFLTTGLFDTFSALYAPAFNSTNALSNALIANDDLLGLTTSGFAANLTAGTSYVFVTTGFSNQDFGAFSETVGGPGQLITAPTNGVSEPPALALLGLGIALLGLRQLGILANRARAGSRWSQS